MLDEDRPAFTTLSIERQNNTAPSLRAKVSSHPGAPQLPFVPHQLMDTTAYLKKNGWRGAGHSLDHTNRGIVKPLLISHRTDALGIGKKKTQVADQWWMRAFDESLKELGTGKQVWSIAVRTSTRSWR